MMLKTSYELSLYNIFTWNNIIYTADMVYLGLKNLTSKTIHITIEPKLKLIVLESVITIFVHYLNP